MKVSIIIPVYNVEKYLHECVDSILRQTYRDIEVLLVDDGSPDNCPTLCDEYARRDSRVVAYHKPNGGLSDARNYGLERAKGEYIVFADSDDFWQKDTFLAELVEELDWSPECDFIGFNISYFYEKTKTYKNWVPYNENVSGSQPKEEKIRWMVNSGTIPMSACSKILRRKILEQHHIHFIKGIYGEDILWFMELLDRCNNFKLINKYVYAYRQGVVGSITNSFSRKKVEDLFHIIKSGIAFIKESSFSAKVKDAMFAFMAYEYLILLANIHNFSADDALKKEFRSYQWLLKYTENPKVKISAQIYKFFGLKVTEWVMRLYMIYRSSIGIGYRMR